MNYEAKILMYLVDKYHQSKKDSGANKINRRTRVKPEKFYKHYNDNNGDFETITALNAAAAKLAAMGFIKTQAEQYGTQLLAIDLVDARLADIERYLEEHYAYVAKTTKLQLLQSLIEKYEQASPSCAKECEQLKEKLQKRQPPKDLDKLDAVFQALAFVENNKTELYIREVSMQLYGDSKQFEETTLAAVCSLLRKYDKSSDEEGQAAEMKDEILKKYHITREPDKLCLKGRAIIEINGLATDISGFASGIELCASELANITAVRLLAKRFITIENRTSYLRYLDSEAVIFYLGGYANRYQRDFIKLLAADNPSVEYLHFGDIDAGGFRIHHNLCQITGQQFALFNMSARELANPVYQSCLHKLTANDVKRLQELQSYDEYRDVISYMLQHNVKLEQEAVSLALIQNSQG